MNDMLSRDTRFELLLDWIQTDLGRSVESIVPASSDASFRRYFRLVSGQQTYIVMDAPPPSENVRPFVAIAGLFRAAGVQTPEVFDVDVERGFVLLGDFGSRSYLDELNENSADALYRDALSALLMLQQRVRSSVDMMLPEYDEPLLRRELGIFREWFLGHWLSLELTSSEAAILDTVWQILVDSALDQPSVCVHRDYHSRNLMVTDTRNPGVLDFQDAVIGPLTYDLVSLLRDCYVDWPEEQVQAWKNTYRNDLLNAGLLQPEDIQSFDRWFDLMGMQRHLKAAGIFARLKIRDGKAGYLKDIPRTLGYVVQAGKKHPDLQDFVAMIETRILPRLAEEVLS